MLFDIVSHGIAGYYVQGIMDTFTQKRSTYRGIALGYLPDLDALTQIPVHTGLLASGYPAFEPLLHPGYLADLGVPEAFMDVCNVICHKSALTHSVFPGALVPLTIGTVVSATQRKTLKQSVLTIGTYVTQYASHLLLDSMHGDFRPWPFTEPMHKWTFDADGAERLLAQAGLLLGMATAYHAVRNVYDRKADH